MVPPCCWTMPYTIESPSPVPVPGGLVVKNGSNTPRRVSPSTTMTVWCPDTAPPPHPPAVRHGAARVHCQVHEPLLDLAGIHLDTPGGARHRPDLDVLADQPSEHRHHLAAHHVKVHHHS